MNNKTMNKTLNFILIIVMMLLSIQLVSALSFQDLADDMQSFASGSYSENNKAIDFILFFILFTSVCYIGLKQAMGDKEGIGGAVKALSAALGTALTLALISFTEFSLFIFYPFAKGLIFFLFVLLVFFVLTKIGMEKHKVWAFIIALILALVIFNFGAMWIGANKGDNDFSLGSFAGKFSLGGIKDRLNIDGIKEKFSSSKESGKTKAEIALDDIYLKIGELTSIGDNKILRLYKTEKSLEERIST